MKWAALFFACLSDAEVCVLALLAALVPDVAPAPTGLAAALQTKVDAVVVAPSQRLHLLLLMMLASLDRD